MPETTKMLPFRMMRIVVLIAATLVFLMTTHPVHVPAIMLVLPFVALFACLYFIVLEVIRFFQPNEDEGNRQAPVYRPRLLAAVVAGFPILLLVLQSIMQLNRWDVLIALAIFVLAYVFVSRGTFSIK